VANTRKSRAIPALHTPESTIAALARVVELMLDQEDLTIQRYRVLIYLASEPASTTELADRLSVRPPTVTRLVDGLAARGYVERQADETDGRRSTHVLTQSGQLALKRSIAAIGRAMDNIGRNLTASERRRADAGLALWAKAMRDQWIHTHPEAEVPPRRS